MWVQPRAPRPAQPPRVMPSQWQRDSFSSAAQSAPVGAKAQDPRAERQGEQHKRRFPSRSTPGSRQWKATGTAQLRTSSVPDDARDKRVKRGYTDLQTRSPVRAPTAACAHGSSVHLSAAASIAATSLKMPCRRQEKQSKQAKVLQSKARKTTSARPPIPVSETANSCASHMYGFNGNMSSANYLISQLMYANGLCVYLYGFNV